MRASLLMSSFEMTMPLIGIGVGRGIGSTLGSVANYIAAGCLIALGIYLLVSGEEADEEKEVASLSTGRGLALIGLGISISLDELAMGFTIGLLQLSIWLAVILIGVQAFALAQVGLRVGSRLGAAAREWAERLAAIALLGLGVLILVEQLAR
ncbi:MAG: manganese efflux pump [Actinobacteria bacterium]|nr:manganese efflux pump [Actinomycetota bacterium]